MQVGRGCRVRDSKSTVPYGGAQEHLDWSENECAADEGCNLITMTVTGRIEMNPGVMLGKPVLRGTRIPVEFVLRRLGEGASEAEVLEAYPSLTSDDIRAALRFAADTIAHEKVVFVGGNEGDRHD